MRPVACSVKTSNGTPKTFKAAARLHLHSGLENRRTLIAFPGFESLVSRQDLHKSPANAGLLRFRGLALADLYLLGVPSLLWKCSRTFFILKASLWRRDSCKCALRSPGYYAQVAGWPRRYLRSEISLTNLPRLFSPSSVRTRMRPAGRHRTT